MYLCVCRAVRESEVDYAIDQGCRTFKDISYQTGCSKECGQCAQAVKGYIEQRFESSVGGVTLRLVG